MKLWNENQEKVGMIYIWVSILTDFKLSSSDIEAFYIFISYHGIWIFSALIIFDKIYTLNSEINICFKKFKKYEKIQEINF